VLFADAAPQLTVLINTAPLGSGGAISMNFTDLAFQGLTLVALADSFPNGGFTGTLSGDGIALAWSGVTLSGGVEGDNSFSATFDITTVPEPSGIAFFYLASLFASFRAIAASRRPDRSVTG
jgi:hypothetical protein